ncbi:hypothetical protein KUA17_23215, partial [Vibrio parahaemolyticus]|uniref:DUF7668 domain-containing protein n=2 Tax=Vibrio parahaemolyticus TaxID=670 RepID=UPI001F1E9542
SIAKRRSHLNAALCVSHKKESSMKKPTIESSQEDLIAFVRDWIDLCASGEAEYAFSFLDEPLDNSRSKWSLEDFEMVRFDHFGDNQLPVITSPLTVTGVLRNDIFEYDNGSGWGVEYDLPLNGVVSDFTLLFDFLKHGEDLKVILDDCHVM